MITICSRDNKVLKLARSLQKKKNRYAEGLYFAEGVRMVSEALRDAKEQIRAVLIAEEFAKKHEDFVKKIDIDDELVYTVKDHLFAGICDTETPQGVGVLLKMPQNQPDFAEKESFILALDGVSEPGNLGTMIRTAEAAGVDCVWLLCGCADLYNPKVVRATMGSVFRVSCKTGVERAALFDYQKQGFFVTATALGDSVPLGAATRTEKQILVIGSEAAGVSAEILSRADQRVRIPMQGKVESLNAAVAAGIAMYQIRHNTI